MFMEPEDNSALWFIYFGSYEAVVKFEIGKMYTKRLNFNKPNKS